MLKWELVKFVVNEKLDIKKMISDELFVYILFDGYERVLFWLKYFSIRDIEVLNY